jgi:cyclophilin family peptidyl-prolyl cis-trans isomerase
MQFRVLFSLAVWLAALGAGGFLSHAAAQDDPPVKSAPPKSKAAAKSKATPKADDAAADAPAAGADDFATLYKAWKERVARLYQIQDLFKRDPSADKKALEAEYNGILEKAQTELPRVLAAAEKAYAAAPNQDKELTNFLLANLNGYVRSDDYEKAAELAQLLVDNKNDAKELNLMAGLAFFNTNEFDLAGKYLKAANDSGVTNRASQQDAGMVDKYKEMWAKEQKIRAAEDKANDLPKVKLTTSKGDIVVVLFENEAPIATANFISLVEKKYYDGVNFHRVIPGFMAQGGDPNGDGSGGPGYTIPCECYQENHRKHFRGSLSMAKTAERDTGGSQFFLTFVPTTHLDGQHTVFGRVVEGFDVLAKLQRTEGGPTGPPDKIIKATVLSKRPHVYKPVTRPDKKK